MIAEQRSSASAVNGAGEKRFAGQGAILTGAGSGPGLGIAKRLFREGAQGRLWDCDPAALDSAAACLGGAHAVTVDVVDPAAVEHATQNTVDALGRIDILVASAGITGPNGPAWEYPLSEWSRVMQVNLDGLFCSNRAVVPHFLAAGYGRIVNIASISGKEGNPNPCAYRASKAGVIAFTKSLGKELAETDIRVNCIALPARCGPRFSIR